METGEIEASLMRKDVTSWRVDLSYCVVSLHLCPNQAMKSKEEVDALEKLLRTTKGLLNKFTPEKFEKVRFFL